MTRVCRGVRGATTVDANTRDEILAATRELLRRLIAANDIRPEDVASVIFSTTSDLNAEFPAVAARQLGWHESALFCTHEMNVPGALERCIRVLIHWNTERSLDDVEHVYIREARDLRPDRAIELTVPAMKQNGTETPASDEPVLLALSADQAGYQASRLTLAGQPIATITGQESLLTDKGELASTHLTEALDRILSVGPVRALPSSVKHVTLSFTRRPPPQIHTLLHQRYGWPADIITLIEPADGSAFAQSDLKEEKSKDRHRTPITRSTA